MPRKMRPEKARRATGWGIETLHPLYDVLTLCSGDIRTGSQNPKIRIRSLEDARCAWEENREVFMVMCSCHRDQPCCRQHDTAFRPGTRPWAFWRFDMGYSETPRDELAELKHLELLTKEEIEALKPKPERAEVREFPRQSDEN